MAFVCNEPVASDEHSDVGHDEGHQECHGNLDPGREGGVSGQDHVELVDGEQDSTNNERDWHGLRKVRTVNDDLAGFSGSLPTRVRCDGHDMTSSIDADQRVSTVVSMRSSSSAF